MEITREFNNSEYKFIVTINSFIINYNGFWGSDVIHDTTIECNGNIEEANVTIKYPLGDAYDFYSNYDYADLVEMFEDTGVTESELEEDFDSWFNKNEEYIEQYFIETMEWYLWDDEEFLQECVLDHILDNKQDDYSKMLSKLTSSDTDEVKSISCGDIYAYVPTFFYDDNACDEEDCFKSAPENIKCYPCDEWGRSTGESSFILIINDYLEIPVTLYIDKYTASNYEVGTGWSNIFEYSEELIRRWIDTLKIKTIGDLKHHLENDNRIIMKD